MCKLSNLGIDFGFSFNCSSLLDLPTVEELMQPIRIDSYGIRAFDLQPIRWEVWAVPV